MARTTEFSHDTLGHLLTDHKIRVPVFQRPYAWETDNVLEFLNDISGARNRSDDYFLGTVVLADTHPEAGWRIVVDGQQRMVTTALLIIAAVRKMRAMGKKKAADTVFRDHIANFDLETESVLPKLELSEDDHEIYLKLLEGEETSDLMPSPRKLAPKLLEAFEQIELYLDEKTDASDPYSDLVGLIRYLDKSCQVLLAIASGLSEAYVIFETLNDRGADLTTSDLLKNYFLSSVGEAKVDTALQYWSQISGRFDSSEKLVDFIRSDFISRWGPVKKKDLYRELESRLGRSSKDVLNYLSTLKGAVSRYLALSSPDDPFWSEIATDVRDEILAHRRFNIETPFGMYLSAIENWRPKEYCELLKVGTGWAIRASIQGSLGGGTAEKMYGELALGISNGSLKNVNDVREKMSGYNFLPSDSQFKTALMAVDDRNRSRAKYYLAMLEKAYYLEKGLNLESLPAWDSKGVSVEHIVASSQIVNVGDGGEGSVVKELQHSLPNLTLLERSTNNTLGDRPFEQKREKYGESAFESTKLLASMTSFGDTEIAQRRELMLRLADKAWPK